MELWWESLDLSLQIFYAIGIVSTILLMLQLVLLVFGGDVEADFDVDVDHDHGGLFSLRSISAFFAGFGWAGVMALEAGWSLGGALLAAFLTGAALMSTVFFSMRFLYGLRYSGTLDYANAIGVEGRVYLPIPGSMQGPGQVEVVVQGRLTTVPAMTRAAARIPNRARILVVGTLGPQTLLVEPLDPSPEAAPAREAPATPAT